MHHLAILAIAALAKGVVGVADYCTFYSDSHCKHNANSVSYAVGNQGCISPQGQYFKCDTGVGYGVTLRNFVQPGCEEGAGLQTTLEGNQCHDLAASGLYEPSGSYQIPTSVYDGGLKRDANDTDISKRSSCPATVETWDSDDCTGSSDTNTFQFTSNGDADVNSGCYVNSFARAAAYQSAESICQVEFFDNLDCSGFPVGFVSGFGRCESTGLKGAGSPGSYMFNCGRGACGA